MDGFNWWQNQAHITSEIYLNTHRSDWWRACTVLAHTITGAQSMLDVGGGDGHTLWQILSVMSGQDVTLPQVDIIEPDAPALERARMRLTTLPLSQVQTHTGTLESCGPRILASRSERFDVVLVCHANYYFARNTKGEFDRATHHRVLDLLLQLGKRVVIATSSAGSDYYKVTAPNPFTDDVYSESIARYYSTQGYTVEVTQVLVRFYVAHADQSREEAVLLWQFFHNNVHIPTKEELDTFKCRLREVRDEDGHISFDDEIIVISQPNS